MNLNQQSGLSLYFKTKFQNPNPARSALATSHAPPGKTAQTDQAAHIVPLAALHKRDTLAEPLFIRFAIFFLS